MTISFAYPSPIGNIRVAVRQNRGSDSFIFGEVFDHCYYDLPLSFTPDTILDLGANTGFTALYFARKYPEARIACVEPIPENVNFLQKNLEMNVVIADVFSAAVAVDDGRINMVIAARDFGHKISGIDFGKPLDGPLVDVAAVSVTTILDKLNWDRIGLLKVDIEGYEGILLQHQCEWLDRVDAMCIECHEGFGRTELQAIAQKWGFSAPKQLPGIWLLEREL